MVKHTLKYWALAGFCLVAVSWIVRADLPASQPAKPGRGEIVRLEKDHITAMPFTPPTEGQPDEPITYVMDDSTHVYVSRLTEAHTTPDGRRKLSYDVKPGSRHDLKVGLRARIDADGDTATRISVFIDDPKQP